MGKTCAVHGCGHYRPKLAATAARATKKFQKAVKASECSVFSIPTLNRTDFLDYVKRTGNKHLLSIGVEKIEKLYGICSCHFSKNQLSGKGNKKTLIPGEKPSLNCDVDELDDDSINKLGQDWDSTIGSIGNKDHRTPTTNLKQTRTQAPSSKTLTPGPKDIENIASRANVRDPAQNVHSSPVIQMISKLVPTSLASARSPPTNHTGNTKHLVHSTTSTGLSKTAKPSTITTPPPLSVHCNTMDVDNLEPSSDHTQQTPTGFSKTAISPRAPILPVSPEQNHSDSMQSSKILTAVQSPIQEDTVEENLMDICPIESLVSADTPVMPFRTKINQTVSMKWGKPEDLCVRNRMFGEFVTMQLNLLDPNYSEQALEMICQVLTLVVQQSSMNIENNGGKKWNS